MFPRCHHLSAKRKFKTARSDGLKGATIVGSTLRNFSRTELFSGKAINSQARIRDEMVKQMLGFVGKMQGKAVKIRETAFAVGT
ncbi:hypothetical protein TIFTF001_003631 [Ficus carica]|uniref:Uncharacterized protein n=1 Tax=Ficus carica TaxID=3494 RepID=A0AA87ZSJ6_FICCA|nr:hypothetical protein TIFTF001_003630 [Ficus carica]GMN32327.1 hypothetical protein TIFTF001_003631 [Ficus carica]